MNYHNESKNKLIIENPININKPEKPHSIVGFFQLASYFQGQGKGMENLEHLMLH